MRSTKNNTKRLKRRKNLVADEPMFIDYIASVFITYKAENKITT